MESDGLNHHSLRLRRPQRWLLRRWNGQWHAAGFDSMAVSAGYWYWVRATRLLSICERS